MRLKCTRASFLPSSYSEDLLRTTLAFPKELMIWKVIIAIAVEVTVMKTLKKNCDNNVNSNNNNLWLNLYSSYIF